MLVKRVEGVATGLNGGCWSTLWAAPCYMYLWRCGVAAVVVRAAVMNKAERSVVDKEIEA
jgi:hypothetical protein